MRGFGSLLLCFGLLSSVTACGNTSRGVDAVGSHHHVAHTSGSAVALSYDERVAVATNRGEGFVTVFSLKPERGPKDLIVKTTVVDVGADTEPWAAVIGADDDTAFVILRKPQQLIRIDHLRSNPTVAAQVAVGSEPMGIAISPTGKLVFVANWGEGTVATISTADNDLVLGPSLDLSESLQATGSLGGTPNRPALAHPRALAVTDDGDQDDDDETLYVTEFFSQPTPGAKTDPAAVDSNHQGFVYPISVGTGQQGLAIPLSPVSATGFADSDGNMTSCFPNQLYAAAAERDRLYVTSMCTSPRGPLDKVGDSTANYKTLFHPAVFAIDTTLDPATKARTNQEVPTEGKLLTQVLQSAYDSDAAAGTPTAEPRMPLIPTDIAFGASSKGNVSAYVLALGADTLFRLDYDADGQLTGIGSPQHRYVAPLSTEGYPVGLAVSRRSEQPFALALSDVAQQLAVIDLKREEIADKTASMPDTPRADAAYESPENRGRALFSTGLGVWSFQGAAWSSCESCHPGGLSDGVTWYFARGPRRTLSPANSYEKNVANPSRRLLLWGANADEVHDVEGIVRTVSGGAGALLWMYPPGAQPSNDCRLAYDGRAPAAPKAGSVICPGGGKRTTNMRNGLNGSLAEIVTDGGGCRPDDATCDSSARTGWNDIDAFIRTLRVPRQPTNLNQERVKAGRALFDVARCANCHGGPQWTVSRLFYTPGIVENGAAPTVRPGAAPPLGKLREQTYSVLTNLLALNPVAKASLRTDCPTGTSCATFRAPPTQTPDEPSPSDAEKLQLLYGDPTKMPADAATDAAKVASNDQIRCALRSVGTFPPFSTAMAGPGVAPSTGTAPWEVRQDMTSIAQGKDGFSVPSLFGLAVGAPYFHAGNARSLEELFDDNFSGHHQSVLASFLSTPGSQRDEDVLDLVEFLLSIDDTIGPGETVPADYDFCARSP